jgi:hypothetical protein
LSKSNKSLEERVALAAHAALRDHQYVSPIDVFLGIGWLQPIHVQARERPENRDSFLPTRSILPALQVRRGSSGSVKAVIHR